MKSIDARRALGAILMGAGLMFAAIYLADQLDRSTGSGLTPRPNYGSLVLTSIGKALSTAPANRTNAASSATAALPN